MTFAIILILAGILFITAEVIFIPGTTFVGFVGAAFIILGIVKVYMDAGTSTGHLALGITIGLIAVLFIIALRYNVWSGLALKETIDSRFNDHVLDALFVGDTGITKSALRPVGKALIHDKEYEVQTLGGYMNEGTTIRIIEIKQLKIFVESLES
ncbi:MAG: hypothetical protein H7259_09770 [Cytophagales bacterium]|nr:hypothetical protein [Cytophaga sp.]